MADSAGVELHGVAGRPERERLRVRSWPLRFLAVGLPAVLAGGFEFARRSLLAGALPQDVGNLITAGLAALAGLVYFETVSRLVARLLAEAQRDRTERAVAAQRQNLADQLHDNLSQMLFFLHVRLKAMRDRARGAPGAADHAATALAADLGEAADVTEELYLEVRETIRRLQAAEVPPSAPSGSLERLVRSVLPGDGVAVRLEGDGSPRGLDARRWAVAQSILLEALRNVRKHAAASGVRVWLQEAPGGGRAGVEDDGRGYEAATASGYGLSSIRRRAAAAGLDVEIAATPGHGARVEVSWRTEEGDGAALLSGADRR